MVGQQSSPAWSGYDCSAPKRSEASQPQTGDRNVGFASSSDLRKSWYHPQIKIPAGERAAKWALVTRYGLLKGRDAEDYWLPPMVEKVEAAGGSIRLTMSTEVKTRDDRPEMTVTARCSALPSPARTAASIRPMPTGSPGETKNDRNRVEYEKNILVLTNRFVPAPVHYRYAWARNPMGNLVNNHGVALAGQRSDDWILEETPVKISTPKDMPEDAARRQAANQLRKELERDDLARRVKEAEATIAEPKPALEKVQAAGKQSAADSGTGPAGAEQ